MSTDVSDNFTGARNRFKLEINKNNTYDFAEIKDALSPVSLILTRDELVQLADLLRESDATW